MSLYKRGEVWWVNISVNGHRIRQSTETNDKQQAQEAHDQIKYRAKQLKYAGKLVSDALKLWLTATERTDREKSSIKVFLRAYPNRPLSQVDGHEILDTFKDLSSGYYNRISNIVRSAFNMAAERGWCHPIKIYRRKETSKKLRYLTQAEWANLKAQLPPHVLDLATFALNTGLRQANVFNLKWQDVNLQAHTLSVDASEAKARKSFSIPLNQAAVSVLNAQIGKHDVYVFTYDGKSISSAKTAFGKALLRAGIKDFRWHDFRHTWASWHVMGLMTGKSTPLPVLKELGGWSDIKMVMRYAHLAPSHLRQWV